MPEPMPPSTGLTGSSSIINPSGTDSIKAECLVQKPQVQAFGMEPVPFLAIS
jgi:hypothetical protein